MKLTLLSSLATLVNDFAHSDKVSKGIDWTWHLMRERWWCFIFVKSRTIIKNQLLNATWCLFSFPPPQDSLHSYKICNWQKILEKSSKYCLKTYLMMIIVRPIVVHQRNSLIHVCIPIITFINTSSHPDQNLGFERWHHLRIILFHHLFQRQNWISISKASGLYWPQVASI